MNAFVDNIYAKFTKINTLQSKGGKKSPNPLAHPNLLTNCPTKLTYLINRQMDASPIRPN